MMSVATNVATRAAKLYNEGKLEEAYRLALTSIEVKETFLGFEIAALTASNINEKHHYLEEAIKLSSYPLGPKFEDKINLIRKLIKFLNKEQTPMLWYLNGTFDKMNIFAQRNHWQELYEVYREMHQAFGLPESFQWYIVKKISKLFVPDHNPAIRDEEKAYETYIKVYQESEILKKHISEIIKSLFLGYSKYEQLKKIDELPSDIAAELNLNKKKITLQIEAQIEEEQRKIDRAKAEDHKLKPEADKLRTEAKEIKAIQNAQFWLKYTAIFICIFVLVWIITPERFSIIYKISTSSFYSIVGTFLMFGAMAETYCEKTDYFKHGNDYYDNEHYGAAIAEYNKFIKQNQQK